jgi:hypothetical protein
MNRNKPKIIKLNKNDISSIIYEAKKHNIKRLNSNTNILPHTSTYLNIPNINEVKIFNY